MIVPLLQVAVQSLGGRTETPLRIAQGTLATGQVVGTA